MSEQNPELAVAAVAEAVAADTIGGTAAPAAAAPVAAAEPAADGAAAPEAGADGAAAAAKPQRERKPKEPKAPKPAKPAAAAGADKDKKTGDSLGLTAKKFENFSAWYSQLVIKSELIDYYDISGCYILRPWGYQIWEFVQQFIDSEIKKQGVKNSYFPMFVPKRHLETEKDHVEGFAAEVAWVTHSGTSKLEEPIAVRPTSETIMYPAFGRWIRSYRDLPMKLNQWCNVVRWEFKYPTPFIRAREFLWQEGHTAFATQEEAEAEVLDILDVYHRTYKDILAVSTVKGKKTEHEKFPGGLFTTTVEGFVPANGRGVQAATSHCLGTNFAKMFNIKYLSENSTLEYAWQNSWGFTFRSIGVMIMNHADDKGLVLPPRVAPTQVVIVPIFFKDKAPLLAKGKELEAQLAALGVRAEFDAREQYTPGWKFTHWELKGIPIRLEIGPKDLEKEQCVLVRRDTGEKAFVPLAELATAVPALLEKIQVEMYERAHATHMQSILRATSWAEFMAALSASKLALIPHCGVEACEKSIKVQSAIDSKYAAEKEAEEADESNPSVGEKLTGAAKSLCIPFEQPEEAASTHNCIKCGTQAQAWILFGRSY